MRTLLEGRRERTRSVEARATPRPLRVADWASVLLSLLAVTVAVLVVADVRSPVRALLTFAFVMIAPGRALLCGLGLSGGWLGAALVVATSASLATALATAQLYFGLWSPTGTVIVLVLVTLGAQAVSYFAAHRRSGSSS